MSTNFYWKLPDIEPVVLPTGCVVEINPKINEDDPHIHIGKRYSTGGGTMAFAWAQDHKKVMEAIKDHKDDAVITDEYGRLYTGYEFAETVVAGVSSHVMLIGKWFS